MKRSAFFAILLAVLLLMTACGGADGDGGSHDENNGVPNDTPNGPQEDGTQTETPDAGEDGSTEEDENGAVALDLSADGKMTVTVDEFMVFDHALNSEDLSKLAESYGK